LLPKNSPTPSSPHPPLPMIAYLRYDPPRRLPFGYLFSSPSLDFPLPVLIECWSEKSHWSFPAIQIPPSMGERTPQSDLVPFLLAIGPDFFFGCLSLSYGRSPPRSSGSSSATPSGLFPGQHDSPRRAWFITSLPLPVG